MLSRTFPSLATKLVSPIAGSSRSRTNYAILRQTTQIGRQLTPTPISIRRYTTPADSAPAPGPAAMDEGEKAIYEKLSAKFPGNRLEVQDVSGGCGSFYAILISSPAFKGLSTIKQHKLVNSCLKEDIKTIHGLQLKTIPEE